MKEGGRSASEGPGRHRARNVLVVAEVALALVLLVVSGLMVRTFLALGRVEPGFVRPETIQTFRVAVPEAVVERAGAGGSRGDQQIVERLAGSARRRARWAVSTSITMDGGNSNDPIFVEDKLAPSEGQIRRCAVSSSSVPTTSRPWDAGSWPAVSITWPDIYQGLGASSWCRKNFAREFWKDPVEGGGPADSPEPQEPVARDCRRRRRRA